jgi:hypothetical protein
MLTIAGEAENEGKNANNGLRPATMSVAKKNKKQCSLLARLPAAQFAIVATALHPRAALLAAHSLTRQISGVADSQQRAAYIRRLANAAS